jgi:hypothetical protein
VRKADKALTLVELLIASTVFVLVMTTVYSAFHTGIFGFRDIEENLDIHQTARQVLERVDLDLRNMFPYSAEEAKFKGDKNSLSFLTLVDKFSSGKMSRNYAFVFFNLKEDKIMRLELLNKDSLKQEPEAEPEELASRIKELQFSYAVMEEDTQQLKWLDLWEDAAALPAAVKVNIAIDSKTGQEFERTIYIR